MDGIAFVNLASILGAGICIGIGAIGAGIAMGFAGGKAGEAIARQPRASDDVVKIMLIGQAMCETPAIFALVISFLLLFATGSCPNPLAALPILSAGICMGLGALGPGLGSGFPNGMACEGVGRQPENFGTIMTTMLIGQALCQSGALFAFVVAFILRTIDLDAITFIPAIAYLAAGLCMGSGAIGPGIGLGMAAGGACDGISRFPETRGSVFTTMLVGQAVSETTVIYSLVVALLLIYVVV